MIVLTLVVVMLNSALAGFIILGVSSAAAALLARRDIFLRERLSALSFWAVFAVPLATSFLFPLLSAGQMNPVPESANSTALIVSPIELGGDENILEARFSSYSWLLQIDLELFILVLTVVACVAGFRFLHVLRELSAARRLRRSSQPLQLRAEEMPPNWPTNLAVAESGDIQSPVVVGIIKPCVILPLARNVCDETALKIALSHEAVHVRRRDLLHTLAQEIICAAFWWNPGLRRLSSSLDLHRESACDALAMRDLGVDRAEFAQALLFWGRQSAIRSRVGMLGLFDNRLPLEQRIHDVLNGPPEKSWKQRMLTAVVSLAAMTVAGWIYLHSSARAPVNVHFDESQTPPAWSPRPGT